ncbi:hypothetical protein [Naasia sp. SYSU D00057]|uniref:hypothetical protein n=1 Tax=Naasia sp. SYSU D00057 TaxID=2817380 RepID=UPI001B30818E|nr:hypothetical protein [Naasia sp. SYSU D00057]
MKVHRDDVAEQLRAMGRDAEAERALQELPEWVDVKRHHDELSAYGLGPQAFDQPSRYRGWVAGG